MTSDRESLQSRKVLGPFSTKNTKSWSPAKLLHLSHCQLYQSMFSVIFFHIQLLSRRHPGCPPTNIESLANMVGSIGNHTILKVTRHPSLPEVSDAWFLSFYGCSIATVGCRDVGTGRWNHSMQKVTRHPLLPEMSNAWLPSSFHRGLPKQHGSQHMQPQHSKGVRCLVYPNSANPITTMPYRHLVAGTTAC